MKLQASKYVHFLSMTFFFMIIFAVAGHLGMGCKETQKPAVTPEKITFALTSQPNGSLAHIAYKKGYFAEEGVEITPQMYSFGKVALNAVIEGKADMAIVAETPIMFSVMKGDEIYIIATIETSNRNEAIIGRKDKGILKPKDLKGKRVGVTFGTTGDFFMHSFFVANGIERKEVQIVNLKPDEMLDAVISGKIDAASTWHPPLIMIHKKLGDKGITFYDKHLYTETFNVVAKQDYVKKHPDTIKKVIRALIKAEGFIKQNPNESMNIVADSTGIEKALLSEVLGEFEFKVTLTRLLLVALEDQTRWAIKIKLVEASKMPNYLYFIYAEGLQAVKPEAVRIIR
jgi:NitT/TauT family transport system substrate-binding protein